MRLEGRLTGHFLTRVVLLVGGLGFVFLAWIGALAFSAYQTREAAMPPTDVLRDAAGSVRAVDGAVSIDGTTTAAVKDGGYWLQVLDERGDELAEVDRPDGVPTHYTPGGLVLYRSRPSRIGQKSIATWVEIVDGRELTFVLGDAQQERLGGRRSTLAGMPPSPSGRRGC
ncbi:MAG: hypothetical protein ACYC5I_09410 [Coriobacteriia bacterium]